MATLADSLVSSSARRLPIRKRSDLSARRHTYQGRSYWVVKEPVGLNYFRFQEEEFAILQWLDGTQSLDSLKEQFEDEFPPQKITVEELAQFLGMLHRSGLVVTDAPGQGRQLKKRRDERKRKEWIAALSNVLAIRFKGIDPERLLTRIYPWFRWMYTKTAVIICCTLAISALLLVAVQFDVFRSKLPSFHNFFAVENWIWMGLVLCVTKVIHEFGHGLTCKHFGGECHEMGVMILVLTPCLYCNVSDSWMLPNKWHRAMIGAGGMYIEVVMASIATFIWWFTQDGMLNFLCLSTMFICSVSTIIFNANPLLRYDGYYILSDIVEIPNLRQKSSSILQRKLAYWCLGIEQPEDPFLPQRNQMFFALYTVAAVVYRWVVVLSILMFLYSVFEPYGLKIIGQTIAAMSIFGLVVQPLWKLGKFFYVPGRLQKVKKPRLYATLGIVALVISAVLFIPLPHHVMCPMWITPQGAERIYIAEPGFLEEVLVEPGETVRQGDILARLSNPDLDLEIAKLQGEQSADTVQLMAYRSVQFDDDQSRLAIDPLERKLKTTEIQLDIRGQKLAKLTLVAPTGGTVMPMESRESRTAPGQLPSWSGSIFEGRNEGAFLERQTPFCYIGDPRKLEASVAVDQSSIDFVRSGQAVEIMLDQLSGRRFVSHVGTVAQEPMKFVPKQLSDKTHGGLLTELDQTTGREIPLTTTYSASAPLENGHGLFRLGMRGRVKIHTANRTLWDRFWRFVSETFSFRL